MPYAGDCRLGPSLDLGIDHARDGIGDTAALVKVGKPVKDAHQCEKSDGDTTRWSASGAFSCQRPITSQRPSTFSLSVLTSSRATKKRGIAKRESEGRTPRAVAAAPNR